MIVEHTLHRFFGYMIFAIITMFILLIAMATLSAQVITGAISGTVVDPSGAPIPGAAVVVTNEATSVTQRVTTDNSGFYSAEGLSDGFYTVDVSKPSFSEDITKQIHLTPGQRYANNITLQVGNTTSTVSVTANVEQINTETSENSGTLSSKQIDNLMLNGRNFQTLAVAIPGVSSTADANALAGGGLTSGISLIINGDPVSSSVYTIDGIYDMNSGSFGAIDILPVVDGITEFTVLKDNYSAKYGFVGSGQVVVETKSGTNTFHGSAWDYFRNTSFNADNYFSTTPQQLHQNIFGYTLGGPLIIPKLYNTDRSKKTYFFALNQWYSIHAGLVERGSAFPEALRVGDFSNSPTLAHEPPPLSGSAANPLQLTLDANSKALLAGRGLNPASCLAPGADGRVTQINPSCFDPVAVALINAYMPLPNNASQGFVNYINQGSENTSQLDYQYRVDHSFTDNNLLTARVMYEPVTNTFPYNEAGGIPFNTTTSSVHTNGLNALIRLQSTITPHLLNTASVAETYTKQRAAITSGGTLPEGVSIVQAFPNAPTLNRVPNISLSEGWSGFGVGTSPFTASDGEGLIADDVSWVKGNHVLQAGAFYMFGIKRQTVFTNPQGTFTFTGTHTGDPAADYLLGLDSQYTQASSERLGNFHYRQGEAYLQDDWRATPRLTLNLGLRWVYFSSDTASGDQVTTFSPALYNPAQAPEVNLNGSLKVNSALQPVTAAGQVANLLNGLVFAGQNGVPSGFFTPAKTNFGPRAGFAYDLTGDQKTSLRGGYGVGYARIPISPMYQAFGQNPPYNQSASILNSLLSNSIAGTTAAPTPQTLKNVPLSFTPSQIQSYSLSLERQLRGNLIGAIAYAGSLARHLEEFNGGYDINFPLPLSAPTAGSCLAPNQQASNSYDFDPCINTGKASENYTRPYQGYASIISTYDGGSSNYNALQSRLTYRTGPSQLSVAYTYSKTLATLGGRTEGGTSGQNSGVQNPRNFHAEYGPPDYDFTNDITGTWVYSIPTSSHADKPASLLLRNWLFAGLALYQSGFALSPSLSTSNAGVATRPNQIAPYQRVGKLNEWFNTSSFAAPAYGFFGNAANGVIRGPSYTSFNVALYRTFNITDRLATQFRAEAFNVANHPNFENVSTGVGSGSYGQVTSAGDPRIFEFALKVTY